MVLYPSASALANAKSFDLAAGSDLRDIGFRLNSAPQFTISGQLMDAKTKGPAGAAFVGASSADLALTTFVEGTVRDGRFQIDGLKPDRYFLKFDWVRPGNSVKRTVIFPFEMGNADQTDVVLTAMPPVTVTGHVRTGKHPMPKTIAVTLLPSAEAISAHVGGNVGSTEIRADGTFTMTGVEAGEYRLGIHSAFPPRFFVKERTLTIDGSGPITGADLVLDFSAGSVVGRALDSAGKIIPSATVVLQSTDVEKRLIGQYRHIQRASMSGEYEITGVVPGDYLLFVWKGHPGLIGDPDLFAEASEEAIRLRVPAGATVSQNAVEMNATQ
jgi:hypothetical protein